MRKMRSGLLVTGFVILAAGCGSKAESPAKPAPAADPAAAARGRLVFETEGCGACHGDQLEGTEMGPPLTAVASHWKRAELEAFLKEPAPVLASDPRLIELGTKYEVEMPGVSAASDPEVSDLAAYLLAAR